MLAVLALAYVPTAGVVARQMGEQQRVERVVERQTAADCPFFRDVASLPVGAASTVVGQRLIKDARTAYIRRGCVAATGALPAGR